MTRMREWEKGAKKEKWLDLRYNSAKWTLYGDDGGVASGHVA
jgi:hypothetical protein